jgi:hypothetical protein
MKNQRNKRNMDAIYHSFRLFRYVSLLQVLLSYIECSFPGMRPPCCLCVCPILIFRPQPRTSQFLKIRNNNMANAQTYKVGATLAMLNTGS